MTGVASAGDNSRTGRAELDLNRMGRVCEQLQISVKTVHNLGAGNGFPRFARHGNSHRPLGNGGVGCYRRRHSGFFNPVEAHLIGSRVRRVVRAPFQACRIGVFGIIRSPVLR
ncbi:hypothetical protein SDC9_192160 [bioreactor metagenome]|uniref:Uncharacterized protein n=1 Tax=bioreactor metagenome TaxID=1076179 RepID=A0A645HZX5_9ZZZZ